MSSKADDEHDKNGPLPNLAYRRVMSLSELLKSVSLEPAVRAKRVSIKQLEDHIWHATFMHYDLGYFDLEQKTLQPLDNPFGPRV